MIEIWEMSKMIFKLKEIRLSKGFSQNDLARAVDMTVTNLQKYEYGKMKSYPHDTLEKFCKVLGCQPGDLLVLESEDTQAA